MSSITEVYIIAFVLIVWFKTNAFCEYLTVFGFSDYFKIDQYYEERKKFSSSLHYTDFLILKYNSFFTRLVSCPICLNIWLCIIASLILEDKMGFFYKFLLTSIIFYTYCYLLKLCKNDS